MSIAFALASLQALFLLSLLFAKRERTMADRMLMLWLTGIGFHTAILFAHFQWQWSVPLLLNLNAGFPYLQGPLLLGYVAAVVGRRDRLYSVDLVHLLPFMLFVGYLLVAFGPSSFSLFRGNGSVDRNLFDMPLALTGPLLVSVPLYVGWSIALLNKAGNTLSGGPVPGQFRWLRVLVFGLALVWLMLFIVLVLWRGSAPQQMSHPVFWALALFVYVMGYLGLTRGMVFSSGELQTLRNQMQPKYKKSGLGEEDARRAHHALLAWIDHRSAFLDNELSLQSLAKDLDLSPNHLSQVINELEGCGFHEFVNQRRIAEAQRQLRSHPEVKVLDLAMAVGFNSKSSFNRAFKKFTGQTPSQWSASQVD